ncbi:MAG: WzyE family oligosaccharide polymerase [Arsenophonus sp.]
MIYLIYLVLISHQNILNFEKHPFNFNIFFLLYLLTFYFGFSLTGLLVF